MIWADESRDRELTRFHFPRSSREPWLCIADFFRPIESNDVDTVAFQIVTMGNAVSERTAKLFADGPVPGVPAAARARGRDGRSAGRAVAPPDPRGAGASPTRTVPAWPGCSASSTGAGATRWGYPACPDLEDNERVAELLGADELGIEVTEETGYQYQPEQTTSAIICHHPKAKYFVAR